MEVEHLLIQILRLNLQLGFQQNLNFILLLNLND